MKTDKQKKMAIWANYECSFQKQMENKREPTDIICQSYEENKKNEENEKNEENMDSSKNKTDDTHFAKRIVIEQKQKRVIKHKEKQKRVITKEKRWILTLDDYNKENQKQFLQSIYNKYMTIYDDSTDEVSLEVKYNDLYKQSIEKRERIVFQELYKKIYGYKRQDIEKNILCPEKRINFPFVLQKIIDSNFVCFYCHDTVQILYENVREPMQWTLDRIDNSFGHNIDNVEIACLNCNLRRRTIHYQRYLLTKQLSKIRKIGLLTDPIVEDGFL